MIDLTGKAALVTGASKGIGLAAAQALAEAGAAVALAARSADALEAEAAALRGMGASAVAVPCDVTRYADVAAAVEATHEAFGQLDILVNNAGVIDPIGRLADTDPEAWDRALDVNVKGVYHGLRAALPVMAAQGSGVVVNISSGAANSALEGWSQYCSAKAAAKRLTEVAHKEYGAQGVRVVGLSPGTVATDMQETIRDSGINPVSQLDWSAHIPADWAGKAVVFLCGPEGGEFAGTDFSIKTDEGRARVGLPPVAA